MTEFDYKTTYSKRKTVAIKISSIGEVIVYAPLKTPKKVIDQIIENKKDWLLKHLGNIEKKKALIEKLSNDVLYLGSRYPIHIEKSYESKPVVIRSDGAFLKLKEPTKENIKHALYRFHVNQTQELVSKCVEKHSQAIGKAPNRVTIKNQKTRWGSCSSLQNLNFNWRLSMAPFEVVEYIVVHELCHLVHMNHSSEFWSLVEKHCPNYRVHKNWLKEWGFLLFG